MEGLNTGLLNNIGNRAKVLNKDMDDILRGLSKVQDINYDKNKIDYLFELLEKQFMCGDHLHIVTERLKALETIHRESPNIQQSINNLQKKQEQIDLVLKVESKEIGKTKRNMLEVMQDVQKGLTEVTMMQKSLK